MPKDDATLQHAGRRPHRRAGHAAERPAPPLDEEDDWATERDDPTFGKSPAGANRGGRPLAKAPLADMPSAGKHGRADPDDE